jgi:hypothetical protein
MKRMRACCNPNLVGRCLASAGVQLGDQKLLDVLVCGREPNAYRL